MTAAVNAIARPEISRPGTNEHADWAITYINDTATAFAESKLSDVRDLLAAQPSQIAALLASVSEDESDRGYAPDKWTIKESLIHMMDVERVFAYRLLRIARADMTPLPGFEHNDWIAETRASARSLPNILAELSAVRAASSALVGTLDERALGHIGTVNGNPFSPRAFTWMITGHTAHHIFILRDRYLPALGK